VRHALPLLAAAVFTAGALAAQSPAPRPAWTRQPKPLRDPRLHESSGVVVSRTQPGILWTFNDSGNPPDLFATDTAGRALGRWRITGARNRDWEAMTLGPGPCPGGRCLYVGDIGDNDARYRSVTIYRVAEPRVTPRSAAALDSLPVLARLEFRYPDGAHDAESLFSGAEGDLYIITKPRVGRPELFRVPASDWGRRDTATAELLDSLPIEARSGIENWVTDAAIGPDGRTVAVRTYGYLYFFSMGRDGRLTPLPPAPACDLAGLGAQGEGVDWLDAHTFVLTSERLLVVPATVALARCGG
jgi:hypothetical protein